LSLFRNHWLQHHAKTAYIPGTLRDLAKISEINQKIFRQQTPRAMLNTAVNEVGAYLHCSRALAVFGAQDARPKWPRSSAPQACALLPARKWCCCFRNWKKRSPTN